jgi:hypothetical protein
MASLNSDNNINVQVKTTADTDGIDKASHSLNKLQEKSEVASGSTGNLTSSFLKAQIGAQLIEGAFNKVSDSAKSYIDDTMTLGKETNKMMRELGVTAEQGSALVSVFNRFGLGADGASKSLGIFAKNMVAAKDGNQTAIDHFKLLGLTVKDNAGQLKNTSDLFMEVADKFKGMQAGAEKTALAMQLFGKSGKDMLPLLNQGSSGILALEEHAKKLGLVLSQDNVDAIKKNMVAQKDYKEAMEGVKIQIGNALMPMMTKFSQHMTAIVESDKFQEFIKKIPPIIGEISAKIKEFVSSKSFHDWMNKAKDVVSTVVSIVKSLIKMWHDHAGAMRLVIQAVGVTVVAFMAMYKIIGLIKAIQAAYKAFRLFMLADPIYLIITAIIIVIVLLAMHWKKVCEVMKTAWHEVSKFFNKMWQEIVEFFHNNARMILSILLGPIGAIILNWHTIINFFGGLWGKLAGGFSHAANGMYNWARDVVNGIVGFFASLPGRVIGAIGNIGARIGNDIKSAMRGLHIPGFATGVRNFSGGLALVGEQGPELVNLPAGSNVYSNKESQKMTGSSNTSNVTIGTVMLGDQGAVGRFFNELDQDTMLSRRGFAPNRGMN